MSARKLVSGSLWVVACIGLACVPSCGARTSLELTNVGLLSQIDGSAGVQSASGGSGAGGKGSAGHPASSAGWTSTGGVVGAGEASGAGGAAHAGAGAFAGGPADAGPEPRDAAPDAPPIGCDADAGMVLGPDGCTVVAAPRLMAPLSTSTVTSQSPTLHWALAPGTEGARVELCRDRRCTKLIGAFELDAASTVAPSGLAPGTYFWRAFGRRAGVVGATPSATWQFKVGHRSAALDTSWGTTFDPNGDGYADVIIGAPDLLESGGHPAGSGHAYVFLGSAAGLSGTAATVLTGPATNSAFGVVASAGDVNGDGYADAIVGAPQSSSYAGQVFVYHGGPSGLSSTPATTISAPSAGLFGAAVSSAGDVNGDGYADVIIGASNVHSAVSVQYTGRAYVYFGSAHGIDPASAVSLAGLVPFGGAFGRSVAEAGDVDGDGHADVVVSGSDGIPLGGSAYSEQGRAYLYSGKPQPFGSAPPIRFDAPSEQTTLTIGAPSDFNADGYADLVLGAMGETIELLGSASGLGSRTSLSSPISVAPFTTQAYSYRVTGGGDINGDGYDDAVGSYASIYLFFGGQAGASNTAVVFTPPGQSASIYGYDVIRAGDINADGFDDLVIGAVFDNQFTGRAYVYFGTATGLSALPALVLPGPDGIGGRFG